MTTSQQCHNCFRRQQDVKGVIIWPILIGDEVFGLIRVTKGVKITSAAYCQLLESALHLRLTDVPIQKRCRLIFQNGNARLIQRRKRTYFCH